jgi:Type II CAAX prenyl endopeptidase Rce1-like
LVFPKVAKRKPARTPRARGRSHPPGADPQAWLLEHRPCSYWEATRLPVPSLLFVAPLVAVYEFSVVVLEGRGGAGALRSGADAWLRRGLAAAGLSNPWFLPLLLVVILMGWQISRSREWRFSPSILAGMIAESMIWAVSLVGVGRLVDLGFSYLDQARTPLMALDSATPGPRFIALIGYVGAGVYEETLFRLMLVPTFYTILRVLQTPQVLASSWAVTASAFLFALAHHAGMPGEAFTWYAFIFRWLAGVFFAWVFVLRGFGIAVGTHTAYDILVGWMG